MRRLKKDVKEKLLHGARASISIFLAILLTPFMMVAIMLVEGQKVSSASAILDESMDVSATSVLANYDKYLSERWGLTAVSQKTDIKDSYEKTLKANLGVLGKTFDAKSITAKGADGYSLDNKDVLKSQVLEFCKYNAPVKLADETLNITQLLSSLEGMYDFNDYADMFTNTANVASSAAEYSTCAEELRKLAELVSGDKDDCVSKYSSFESDMNAYVDAYAEVKKLSQDADTLYKAYEAENSGLKERKKEIDELDEEIKKLRESNEPEEEIKKLTEKRDELAEKYNDDVDKNSDAYDAYKKKADERDREQSKLSGKKSAAITSRDNYAGALTALTNSLTSYQSKYTECASKIDEMGSNALKVTEKGTSMIAEDLTKRSEKVEENTQKLNQMKEDNKTGTQEYQDLLEKNTKENRELMKDEFANDTMVAVSDATEETVSQWSTHVKEKYDAKEVNQAKTALQNLREKVAGADPDALATKGTRITKDEYGNVTVGKLASSKDIEDFLREQEDEMANSSIRDLLKSLKEFIDNLFDVNLFYDGALAGFINTDYYKTRFGGLPGDHTKGKLLAVLQDIGDLAKLAGEFGSGLWIPIYGVAKAFSTACEMLKKGAELFYDLADFGKSVLVNIGETLAVFVGNYDRLYYSTYMVYNLPCRVDKAHKTTLSYKLMSGYNIANAHLPSTGTDKMLDGVGEDLQALASAIDGFKKGSGQDPTFCGAELEYILFGSNSEIANQLYVFLAFMLCRLPFSMASVIPNAEAQAMAGLTGFLQPVTMALLVAGEMLIDTVLLVNGESIEFYESTPHIVPTGLAKLAADELMFAGEEASRKLKESGQSLQSKYDKTKGTDKYKKSESSQQSSAEEKKESQKAFESYRKSFGKFSYRDFCTLILLITVSEGEQFARLSNLIQMESLWYYELRPNAPSPHSFDIRKAYAAISATADVNISWSLPSVTGSSWLGTKRTRIRGY